jgi:hypothetical protein
MDSMGEDVDSRENVDCEPRIHMMADRRSEKFSLHFSQCLYMTVSVGPTSCG